MLSSLIAERFRDTGIVFEIVVAIYRHGLLPAGGAVREKGVFQVIELHQEGSRALDALWGLAHMDGQGLALAGVHGNGLLAVNVGGHAAVHCPPGEGDLLICGGPGGLHGDGILAVFFGGGRPSDGQPHVVVHPGGAHALQGIGGQHHHIPVGPGLRQVVEVVDLLVGQVLLGEVGGLEIGQIPLDLHDGLEVGQGEIVAVHLHHFGKVGGRVVQDSLDLIQGVCLPVHDDLLVGDDVAVLVDQAILLQNGQIRLGVVAVDLLQRSQQGGALHTAHVQQVANCGIGHRGQHGDQHHGSEQPRDPSFPVLSHRNSPFALQEDLCTGWSSSRARGGPPCNSSLYASPLVRCTVPYAYHYTETFCCFNRDCKHGQFSCKLGKPVPLTEGRFPVTLRIGNTLDGRAG